MDNRPSSGGRFRAILPAIALLVAVMVLPVAPASASHLFSSVVESQLPPAQRTRAGLYLTPEEALSELEIDSDILFVDVRTRPEFAFVGHPAMIDVNIPLRFFSGRINARTGEYLFQRNRDFVADVGTIIEQRELDPDPTILLIDRDGEWAAQAANLLTEAGWEEVYVVVGGFEGRINPETHLRDLEGWKNKGLPSEYRIRPGTAYWRRVRIEK